MRCLAKLGIKFRRGDTSPEHPNWVFNRYKDGSEVWFTEEQLIALRKRLRLWQRSYPRSKKSRKYQTSYYRRPEVKDRYSAHNWTKEQREKRRKYARQRARTIQVRLAKASNIRIVNALKSGSLTKNTRSTILLGCSIETLRQHLERQFKDGMSWGNFGNNGWHIDHKLPLSMFDLRSEKMQRIAFNFQNLQPLWRSDNIAKSDKIEGELFRGRELRKIIQFRKDQAA